MVISEIISWINFHFRAKQIANAIAPFFKKGQSVLDIGCYDGVLSNYLAKKMHLSVEGVDVVLPKNVKIKAKLYDGETLPFKNKSFDYAILIDVLHHSENPLKLLKEAKRVCKKGIIIKDIYSENFLHYLTNVPFDFCGVFFGIKLPKKYLSKNKWNVLIKTVGMKISYINYAFKVCLIDPGKHVIILLEKS